MGDVRAAAEALRGIDFDDPCWDCRLRAELLGYECGDESCRECREKTLGRIAELFIEAIDRAADLPDGVEWPRYESGELVRFGDRFDHVEGYKNVPVERITFTPDGWVEVCQKDGICEPLMKGERLKRPEPEVLDADGVPIKVGDTVYAPNGEELTVKHVEYNDCCDDEKPEHYVWCGKYIKEGYPLHHIASDLTHRKPDTLESVAAELLADFDANAEGGMEMDGYIERFRKLLGGE